MLQAYTRRTRSLKRVLRPTVNPISSHGMHRDHQHWYSHRLNRYMGVAIYGNYGAPILAFPTSWRRRMGDGRSEHDSHPQPLPRAGAHPNLLHQQREQRFVPKQGSAPFPSELDAGAVRRLCGERSFPVHRLPVPDARHRDRHVRRVARCLSRRQHSLQAS